jgi:hypothetical protein
MCPAGVHKDALGCEDSAKDIHYANNVSETGKEFTKIIQHIIMLCGFLDDTVMVEVIK